IFKFFTSRIFFIFIAFLFQTLVYLALFLTFSEYLVIFYGLEIIIRVLVILYILNDSAESAYKIAWLILIVFFPYLGSIFYLFFSGNRTSKYFKKKFNYVASKASNILIQGKYSNPAYKEISKSYPLFAGLCRYLGDYGRFPVYKNKKTTFFPSGENYFEELLRELKKAEKFIFMEYFIIEEGKMWNEILKILKEKAEKGVLVRIIYDDVGCLSKLPYGYHEKLKKMGIECCVFNPIRFSINIIYNNRDHRKICVIDGKTAFTGGINLADEYINAVNRFGHWKDYGVKFTGEAVWSFTAAFLSVWEFSAHVKIPDYTIYKAEADPSEPGEGGYVIPFADSPFDGEIVSENVYMDIIDKASSYIYITTPYLILDTRTMGALTTVAKRGTDVRIMTPHIPDKKTFFQVTISNVKKLIKS
ncbi:MAG: phospholipase D-like domain-containing protein, partial [Eubacterium sp.]|nr:phospholipase D-like domain-containing protein [Eubacterium sp.]